MPVISSELQKQILLLPDGVKAVGRFTKRMLLDKEQIATLSFDTGLYSLNLKGGEILRDIGTNWVEIDFEMKTNTLFAPGNSKCRSRYRA